MTAQRTDTDVLRAERRPRDGEVGAAEAARILGLLSYRSVYQFDDELQPRRVRVLTRTLRFYDRARVEALVAAKRAS